MPRKLCESCGRPQSVCLCEHLVNLNAPCEVVILQHPSELKQPLATVPILDMCLKPLHIFVGEDFTDEQTYKPLHALLSGNKKVRLLFPADQSEPWSLADVGGSKPDECPDVLVVLDGTWRKAKRIWFSNPFLQALPCAVLTDMGPSQYQIRQSSVEGSMSTLEAVAQACNYLSGSKDYDALYQPFKAMIEMQIKKMGPEIFSAHYSKE